jgi:hypothetical protein
MEGIYGKRYKCQVTDDKAFCTWLDFEKNSVTVPNFRCKPIILKNAGHDTLHGALPGLNG